MKYILYLFFIGSLIGSCTTDNSNDDTENQEGIDDDGTGGSSVDEIGLELDLSFGDNGLLYLPVNENESRFRFIMGSTDDIYILNNASNLFFYDQDGLLKDGFPVPYGGGGTQAGNALHGVSEDDNFIFGNKKNGNINGIGRWTATTGQATSYGQGTMLVDNQGAELQGFFQLKGTDNVIIATQLENQNTQNAILSDMFGSTQTYLDTSDYFGSRLISAHRTGDGLILITYAEKTINVTQLYNEAGENVNGLNFYGVNSPNSNVVVADLQNLSQLSSGNFLCVYKNSDISYRVGLFDQFTFEEIASAQTLSGWDFRSFEEDGQGRLYGRDYTPDRIVRLDGFSLEEDNNFSSSQGLQITHPAFSVVTFLSQNYRDFFVRGNHFYIHGVGTNFPGENFSQSFDVIARFNITN